MLVLWHNIRKAIMNFKEALVKEGLSLLHSKFRSLTQVILT